MKEESGGWQWDWAERIQEVLVQHCSAPHCLGTRTPVSQWDVLTDVLRKLIDLKRPPPPPHTPSVNQQLGQQRAGSHARARAWEVARRTAPMTSSSRQKLLQFIAYYVMYNVKRHWKQKCVGFFSSPCLDFTYLDRLWRLQSRKKWKKISKRQKHKKTKKNEKSMHFFPRQRQKHQLIGGYSSTVVQYSSKIYRKQWG